MNKDIYNKVKKRYRREAINSNFNLLLSDLTEKDISKEKELAIVKILKRFITRLDKSTVNKYEKDITKFIIRTKNDFSRSVMVEMLVYYNDISISDQIIQNINKSNSSKFSDPEFAKNLKSSKYDGNRILSSALFEYYNNKRYIPQIIDLCSDSNRKVQIKSLNVCSNFDDQRANEQIISKTYSNNIDIKKSATRQLKYVNNKDSLYRCIDIIKNTDDEDLNIISIKNIGHLGSELGVGILMYNLSSDNEKIRMSCIESLLRIISQVSKSNSHTIRKSISYTIEEVYSNFMTDLANLIDSTNEKNIRRNGVWLFGQTLNEDPTDSQIKKMILYLASDDKRTSQIATSYLVDTNDQRVVKYMEMYIKRNDLQDHIVEKADFIRQKIEDKDSYKDELKKTVKYTKIDEPADYTEKYNN